MMAVGLENDEIAFVLGVSQETVKTHIKVGLRALGVRNRREAVHVAHQQGLIR